jgi:GDP-4-dehydro-6-deoxy-D-mannose reductase
MNKILITGSNGFIGRALKNKCKSLNLEIIEEVPGDISSQNLEVSYSKNLPDHIFHLAAKTFIPSSWKNPTEYYRTNILGLSNVLEYCRKYCISMTYVSAYIYGEPDSLPISEEATPKPNNPYAQSKWLSEQLCKFYIDNYDLKIAIIRPFNVYGANQRDEFVIQKILNQALSNSDEVILSSLSGRRDYVYVEDVVNALILTIGFEGMYKPINIGYGFSYSIDEIIQIIFNQLGVQKKIVCLKEYRKNEVLDVVADISLAKKILNWQPRYNLKMGIEEVVRIMKGHNGA